MTTYAFDQPVVVTIRTYSDAAKTVPADPTTLSLDLLAPDGTETTSTWAGGGLVKTGTGVFTWTNTPTQAGGFAYHTKSTGAVASGGDGWFTVLAKYGAQSLDLLTLSEAYRALNDNDAATAETGTDDDRVGQMVTAISRRIDEQCGPVVVRTIANEEAEGRCSQILLRHYPVYSVTTITEYQGTTPTVLAAEAFPTVTGNDYSLLNGGLSGIIERRAQGYTYRFAYGRVIATYRAGRYLSTELVDPKFKEATAAILRRTWAREAGRWTNGDPYGDGGSVGPGFFRAIDPMIEEYLGGEMLTSAVA